MAIVRIGQKATKLTAVNDVLGGMYKVQSFVAVTNANGGNLEVSNGNGDIVWESGTMPANERRGSEAVLIGNIFGLELTAAPAGAELIVYYA